MNQEPQNLPNKLDVVHPQQKELFSEPINIIEIEAPLDEGQLEETEENAYFEEFKESFHINEYVMFFALGNGKKRYFLTSEENYFGGVRIPKCMIDSGCSTFLLPLDEQILEILETKYNTKYDYLWNIGGSKGVGALSSPTLIIKGTGNEKIEVVLTENTKSFKMEILYFRFHVSLKMAKILVKRKFINGRLKLKEHIKASEKIAKAFNDQKAIEKFGGERKYALLGQTFLGNFDIVQKFNVIIVLDPLFFEKKLDIIKEAKKIHSLGEICKCNIFPDFDDLEDQDHDYDDDELPKFLEEEGEYR